MADNLGPMAWLFLPENEQVQYLQKIALRAENPSGPRYNSENSRKKKTKSTKNGKGTKMGTGQAIIFRTQCDFLLTIEVSTFSGQVSAIEARDEAIFTEITKIIHEKFVVNS